MFYIKFFIVSVPWWTFNGTSSSFCYLCNCLPAWDVFNVKYASSKELSGFVFHSMLKIFAYFCLHITKVLNKCFILTFSSYFFVYRRNELFLLINVLDVSYVCLYSNCKINKQNKSNTILFLFSIVHHYLFMVYII